MIQSFQFGNIPFTPEKPSFKIEMKVIHKGRFEAQPDDSRIRIREKNQRVSDEEGVDPAET
jgi:hypothetical protein